VGANVKRGLTEKEDQSKNGDRTKFQEHLREKVRRYTFKNRSKTGGPIKQ